MENDAWWCLDTIITNYWWWLRKLILANDDTSTSFIDTWDGTAMYMDPCHTSQLANVLFWNTNLPSMRYKSSSVASGLDEEKLWNSPLGFAGCTWAKAMKHSEQAGCGKVFFSTRFKDLDWNGIANCGGDFPFLYILYHLYPFVYLQFATEPHGSLVRLGPAPSRLRLHGREKPTPEKRNVLGTSMDNGGSSSWETMYSDGKSDGKPPAISG